MSEDDGGIERRCETVARAVAGFGDLGRAVEDCLALPESLPVRSSLAAGLVAAAVRRGMALLDLRPGFARLVAIADREPLPGWSTLRDAATSHDRSGAPDAAVLTVAGELADLAVGRVISYLDEAAPPAPPADSDQRGDDAVAPLVAGIAAAVIGQGDLDQAIADLHRLPAGVPGRGRFAAGLLAAMMKAGTMPGPHRLREIDFLLALAEKDPPNDPQWPRHRTAARVTSLMRASMEGELGDPRAALAQLTELEREGGGDPALRPLFEAARMGLSFARTVHDGDAGAMSRLPTDMAGFLNGMPRGDAQMDQLREMLHSSAEMMAAQQRGDDVAERVRDLRRAAAKLEPGDALRDVAAESLSALDAVVGPLAGDDVRLDDDRIAELAALADRPALSDADRALHHAQVAAAALRGGSETDLARVDLGVDHFRRALAASRPDDPQRTLHLTGLAVGLLRHSELTTTTAGRREARPLLHEARELAGGPHHPQWQLINEMLGEIDRMLGDTADAHLRAVDGLRGHVWQVLVQPDLASATAAVRTAAADAVEVARRCLSAHDPETAIAALDAGRGLALFAATSRRTVGDRLDRVDAGLAARWRAAAAAHDPDRIPAELRRSVLTALAADSTAGSLLDPPGLDEIQDALARVDADALVYLVPGAGALAGFAVIAPVTGPPSYLALPGLAASESHEREAALAVLARHEPAPDDPPSGGLGTARDLSGRRPPDSTLTDELAELCTWAWDAAIGPLVTSYLPRLPAPRTGRPRRLVLVPMGDLARVPWQAARRRDGRHAIEETAISQAASARMLCHSAALPPVPAPPLGLVVGDPDTGGRAAPLTAARLEAYAIRQAYYRGARYVGRRPDGSVSPSGAGTAEQVRAWLTSATPAAGAVLHLACHGFVRTTGDAPTAYLLLAGGERLTAEELVALMEPVPDRRLDLVVLAACRTGLAISGYDEAYSLGTAFLAGGARSVLSTQWSVPDDATSALMFMVHRNLRVAGVPAWQALRDAQLWMLDPAREIPADMPGPLADRLDLARLDEVVAWAAFVHWGR